MRLMVRMHEIMNRLKSMLRKRRKTGGLVLVYSFKIEMAAPERKRIKPAQTETEDEYVFSSIFPNAEVMQRVYKILQENSD